MTSETKKYIESWKEKISGIKGNSLGNLFEKFSTYYTLHNRLYNDSFRVLREDEKLLKPRYSDFEKATSCIVQFNSAENIIKTLTENDNLPDVDAITYLIKNDIFHINLADGVAQKNIDIELMNNLRSDVTEVKARAILSVIYNVRANMLHGEKHFEEHQRMLLEPLIRITQTIVNLEIENLK
ncbi:hypothetical protein ACTHQF_07750 [Pedobacter sp. SAFR-022]|uniref:hypothetical protein n=1 Tax=Pedobacter sp. SAFR-022 TaxID=3436861 RepID=UPI003F81148B